MPGIYVQDGGQLSNSLGDILGGLAANVSPKGRAEADLLRLQSEKADIDAQNAFQQQRLNEAAVRGLHGSGGVTQTLGMEPTVPGTAAAIAQPPAMTPGPGGRISQIDESQFSPTEAYLANETYAGRNPLNTNLPGLFQTATGGPAANYQTQGDIYKAQSTPQHVATGDTLVIDPRKGNAPGNIIVGGDAATVQAEQKQRGIDIDDAKQTASLGAQATQNLVELQKLQEIYDKIVNVPGTSDVGNVIGAQGLQLLKEFMHIDAGGVVPSVGAKEAIASRMKQMLGSTVAGIQGDSPMRGVLAAAQEHLPNPNGDPNQFRGAMGQIRRMMEAQAAEAAPAEKFRNSHFTKEDADAYHRELQAIRAANNKKFAAQSEPGAGGEGGPAAAPAAPAAPASHPATSTELRSARAAIARGVPKEKVISSAKEQGIDLGTNF